MQRPRERASLRLDVPENLRGLVAAAAFLAIAGLASAATAANICNETVPSNHLLDGFPAYAQCTDSTNSSIYSNNGIDTATTSGGAGWVRTQGSGGYQCTEWAHRYLYFRWNVASVPSGNAGVWCDGTIPSGLVKTSIPVHGDIIVFAPGSCGADATTGHVAVVDVVNSNGTVTFVEQNRANRRSCAIDTAACFLHATVNDGSSVDGGTPDAPTDAASAPDGSASPDARPDRYRDTATSTGGSTGTGTGGSGGATGAGGQIGAGGIPGTGGAAASGGATTVVAGEGGNGGATSPSAADSGDGCSCRLSRPTGAPGEWLLVALAVGLLAGLRRRPRPRRP